LKEGTLCGPRCRLIMLWTQECGHRELLIFQKSSRSETLEHGKEQLDFSKTKLNLRCIVVLQNPFCKKKRQKQNLGPIRIEIKLWQITCVCRNGKVTADLSSIISFLLFCQIHVRRIEYIYINTLVDFVAQLAQLHISGLVCVVSFFSTHSSLFHLILHRYEISVCSAGIPCMLKVLARSICCRAAWTLEVFSGRMEIEVRVLVVPPWLIKTWFVSPSPSPPGPSPNSDHLSSDYWGTFNSPIWCTPHTFLVSGIHTYAEYFATEHSLSRCCPALGIYYRHRLSGTMGKWLTDKW
jgi:hypothetical protein